jgi:GDP-L-fucose synthase
VVKAIFAQAQPEYVVLCAAKVGGIHANATYPADFIFSNLSIQSNILSEAAKQPVKRLIFLGSSCIYPRNCPQPIKEEYLLTGTLEPTNRPYAVAKIAGIEMCWAFNRQHSTRFLALMPTNLYGPGDNYDPMNSHVIPALLRKIHTAKTTNAPEVTLWGTGKPCREFLYAPDLAEAVVHLLTAPEQMYGALIDPSSNQPPLINVGTGEDLPIAELAQLIARIVGYEGKIVWDSSKPDGTPKKLLDVSKIRALGWAPKMSLEQGLRLTYDKVKDTLSSELLAAN